MKRRDIPKLVAFGLGGFTVYFGSVPFPGGGSSKSTLQGYASPERFFLGERAEDPAGYEGVPWVDMREAVGTTEGVQHVFRGPMVDVDLAPGAVDRFALPEPWLAACLCDASASFASMLLLHMTKDGGKRGALDYVSVAEWCAGWKRVGAKVGVIRGGQFVELEGGKGA